MNGKLTGMAVRVPTPAASVVKLAVRIEMAAPVSEIVAAIMAKADGPMMGLPGHAIENWPHP